LILLHDVDDGASAQGFEMITGRSWLAGLQKMFEAPASAKPPGL